MSTRTRFTHIRFAGARSTGARFRKTCSCLLLCATLAACGSAPPIALASRGTTNSTLYVARDHVGDGVFTDSIEGPAVGRDGALYAVNLAREGTIGRVITLPDGSVQAAVFVTLPEGSIGNGIRFDRHGDMYIADYRGHNILRIAAGSHDVSVHDVSVHAHEPRMHQPNDIALADDGRLYASDPDWSNGSGQLWRIDRDGSTHLLEAGMGTTNGIDLSPDGRTLYVNESVQRRIWAYDLGNDGTLSNKRLLISFTDHGLDGMRTDVAGNLHVARHGAGQVVVVSPQGRVLHSIALKGDKPSNIAFGGDDGRSVFVTVQGRGAIETYRAEHPGREHGQR